MANWLKLDFKKEDVVFENEKGVLFKLPEGINCGKYVGYCFWHRPKMVKREKGKVVVSFPDNWNFKLFKNGENRELLDEEEIKAKEMLEIITGESFPSLERDEESKGDNA